MRQEKRTCGITTIIFTPFMYRKAIACSLVFILICIRADAALVSGKITNEKNEPLGFASVYAEGTTLGTTANIDGFYKLELKPGKYTLVFRYVGLLWCQEFPPDT